MNKDIKIALFDKNTPKSKVLKNVGDFVLDNICVKAERQFLKQIGGSCHLPVGAYCKIQDAKLILRAMFGTEDGKKLAYTKVESAVLNKIEDSSQIDEICRQIAREVVEKIQIQLSHEE